MFYNSKRRHGSSDQAPPTEYENQYYQRFRSVWIIRGDSVLSKIESLSEAALYLIANDVDREIQFQIIQLINTLPEKNGPNTNK